MTPLTAPTTRRVGALTIGAVVVATATSDDEVVLCPFRCCTGGYCPGCGATRAARRLLGGDVGASWSQHPWVALAVVQATLLAAVAATVARRDPIGFVRRVATPIAVVNVALMLVIWVIRLRDGSIPTGLL